MKIWKCNVCGKLMFLLNDTGVPTICCGEEMHVMEPKTAEMANEKHVPVVEQNGNVVKVYVGSTEHPMIEKHHIEWIILETTQGFYKKDLKVDEKPEVFFGIVEGEKVIAAYEHCNIHGLWVNKL